MKSDILFFIQILVSFLPFMLFAVLNGKANVNKSERCRQYPMPFVAIAYSIAVFVFLNKISAILMSGFLRLADWLEQINLVTVADFLRELYMNWGVYLSLVLFNTVAILLYVIVKRIITLVLRNSKVNADSFVGDIVDVFYSYSEQDDMWYIREHYGQACTYLKTIYYATCFVSGLSLLISCNLCNQYLISAPFYPFFAVIIIGELAFFVDGEKDTEEETSVSMVTDKSRHIAVYPLLRNPLRTLFGDKLSAEGTTVNNELINGGAIEEILADLEKNHGHLGQNYSAFIRKKMTSGLKPNADYVRCGYELASGKSLLFNTPFYDKLNPYVFYAMNRELLTGGKVLVVLGRHGTESDLLSWTEQGMKAVSNIPELWKIEVLSDKNTNEDEMPDIGIISRSGVHDLGIHKNNLMFLRNVSFILIVEPSKLVTTAQIGLKLLINCCGTEKAITFCSVDRNCDGLVDSLSHILMTNITEVSATEYPHGMSSYMYWTADDEYLQHRILPGVSRCLGMGTVFSMVALKNQVKNTVWYGGEVYPVQDARWIAKQYYYDLLDYAKLPPNQETFDKVFQTSFNLCNERVSDYSFVTVEDDRNNLFETRRNFATIAEQQGFVNVVSSEYMLREYMAENTELFTADAKAIPYITADYARTKRNAILSVCVLMCVDSVKVETLQRQMLMMNMDTKDPISQIWNELFLIFGDGVATEFDKSGAPILTVKNADGKVLNFKKDETILYKREYSIESGKFESVYTIENADFSAIILEDLQNASYIAEQESKDVYIGTELKGLVYQKYLPGQFFTLNGKYYEMIATTVDNRILVRRASEHIGGRLSYRQLRNYNISHLEDSEMMGALKSINDIDIHYQFADFSVETPGYWKLHAYNDFDNGDLVLVNGVPKREYHHKQILKLDFSKLGDAFSDSVRMTLTNLLNEAFVTLFAENQPFISAITVGSFDAPITYGLTLSEDVEASDKCIFIVEDSQLDIGLLISVERNLNRIFNIISDYLEWNDEKIEESMTPPKEEEAQSSEENQDVVSVSPKKNLFARIGDWFKGLFGKNKKKDKKQSAEDEQIVDSAVEAEKETENVTSNVDEVKSISDEPVSEQQEAEDVDEKASDEVTEESSDEAVEPVSEQQEAEDVEEKTSDEATEEASDETAEPTEDKPVKKSWFERLKDARKQKKLEKELKKAEKKASKKVSEKEADEVVSEAKAQDTGSEENVDAENTEQPVLDSEEDDNKVPVLSNGEVEEGVKEDE